MVAKRKGTQSRGPGFNPRFNRAAHNKEIHTSPNHKFYGGRMYNSGSPSHTDTGNWQSVPFTDVDYDTSPSGNMVDVGGESFDIPTHGYYDIRVQVRFEAGSAAGFRRVRIVLNGTEISTGGLQASTIAVSPQAAWRGLLEEGDVITFEAAQNDGGNLAYTSGSINMWAEIELVGV